MAVIAGIVTFMGRFDAILFDKDGTLYDFQASWGGWGADLVHTLAQDDPDSAEVLAAVLELDLSSGSFSRTSVAVAGTAADIAATLHPHIPAAMSLADLVRRIDATAAAVEMAEAVPLAGFLQDLNDRGLALGVVTNDSEAPARAHLDRTGVLEFFGFIAGYDSGYGAKPGPGPLLAACESLGVPPERALMVGDSQHDLLAGRAAGMATVGVLTGLSDRAHLAPIANVVLPDIGHLPTWIDGQDPGPATDNAVAP